LRYAGSTVLIIVEINCSQYQAKQIDIMF